MATPTEGEEQVLQDLKSRHRTLVNKMAPAVLGNGCAIVSWDESKAIITGGIVNGKASDSVFVYNKETMETEALPSMIQARVNHSTVIAGECLVVIGGGGPNGFDALNSIEILDLNDPCEWKQYPVSLEIARFNCSAIAVNEHKIYIIGGSSDDGQFLNSVEILNIATQTISQGPPMLRGRAYFVASLVGDKIVVAGGLPISSCEQLSMRVAASDEEDRRWQPLHSMNTGRWHHHGFSFGDCMVVVGGRNNGASLRTTEVWNGATGTWTQLPAELPCQGIILGIGKLGEDLVCFLGGRTPKVYCLFSAKGLLEHQRRQIRFNELIADEGPEIVIPLLLEGLGQRGWTSLFYECIRETNGRRIPRRERSILGRRNRTIEDGTGT